MTATDCTQPIPVPSPVPHWLSRAASEIKTRLGSLLPTHYRPELHYMRGPGPAWRAKYGMDAPFRLKRDL